MAASKRRHPLGSPQEHIQLCVKHDFPVDILCEDCHVFICSTCAKTDHRRHNWVTLGGAASQMRRGLLKYLKKIEEEQLPKVDEKILRKKTENESTCDSQIKEVQEHFDKIIVRLTEIKKSKEEASKANLSKKNEQVDNVKSGLDKKKEEIIKIVKYMKRNNSTMSDKSLIENHLDLTHLLSNIDSDLNMLKNCEHSVRYIGGEIDDDLLESMFGPIFDLDDINFIEKKSFPYSEHSVLALEALSEDKCYVRDTESDYIELVNKQGEKKQKFDIDLNDFCVTNNGIYFTTKENNSICNLSPLGSTSTILSGNPLEPGSICNSMDDGIFVSFGDSESDLFKLSSSSRRLVKHLTLNCDVIHEYEYQEGGQRRLFTVPFRLCQNFNTDICVINITSCNEGEIVILSIAGHLRRVYRGQSRYCDLLLPLDIACDSTCNILVIDFHSTLIHLLSSEGEFLKYLLTEKEIGIPSALSLCKSTLWVGNGDGIVKVFRYKSLP